jgi:cytochrome P450
MEPGPHRARSATLRTAISPYVVAAGEPLVRGLMRTALADLARLHGAQHPHACLDPMVFRGAAFLFFGFAPGSDALGRFERAIEAIDYRRALYVPTYRVRRALTGAMALLGELPPGGFLGALADQDPAAAREPAVVANLLYVFNTAWSDVAGLMSWMTQWLASQPEWLGRLRTAADPDAMAQRIVRETLRLSQSEYIVRRAREPLEFDGFVIPRGWLVRVCIRDIHRRPEVFPDPRRFDPDRFLDPPGPQAYAPFGASRISCLGESMTLMFGRLLALELARGYEIAVADDGPPELGPFHWQPSGRFRVQLTSL